MLLRARRFAILPIAALLLTAASVATTATFVSERPGSDLAPVGDAGALVQILQGNRTVLWTSLAGSVTSYRVQGWPETIAGDELGGAVIIERAGDSDSGVIDFGSRPRELSFELSAG